MRCQHSSALWNGRNRLYFLRIQPRLSRISSAVLTQTNGFRSAFQASIQAVTSVSRSLEAAVTAASQLAASQFGEPGLDRWRLVGSVDASIFVKRLIWSEWLISPRP